MSALYLILRLVLVGWLLRIIWGIARLMLDEFR